MLSEKDLEQIKNLVLSFHKKHKYYPFVEDLMKEYALFFPQDLDEETKNQIDNFITEIIEEEINKKDTKGWKLMSKILKTHEKLWKEFRKLNSPRFFNESKFQELGKQIETIMDQWESRLVEKLVWWRSIWIWKASNAWFDMIYAIFPEWNKIK
jgi:hypothetical protein